MVLPIFSAVICLLIFDVVFGTEDCRWELHGSIRQPEGSVNIFRSLLSNDEFVRAERVGTIYQGFVVRLAEISEIREIIFWSQRQSNAFFVWSRRSDGEWMPLKNVMGERRVIRVQRKAEPVLPEFKNATFAVVADEFLLLPLRRPIKSKDQKSFQWKFYGCSGGRSCRFFDGSDTSRFVYDLKRHGAISDSIGELSFHLNTRSHSAVVLTSYGSQGDFVLVQLRNGRLMMVLNLGGNQPRFLSSPVNVNDGLWHAISLRYFLDDCELYVDGVLVDSSSDQLLGYRLDLDRNILVGGAAYVEPFLKYTVADNFTGYIENLVWNNRPIKMWSGNAGGCNFEAAARPGSLLAITNGNGWIQKRGRATKGSSSPILRLSGGVRTTSTTGIVWRTPESGGGPWSDSLSSFNLSLIEGTLACRMVLNGDTFMLKSPHRVNDGLWHKFHLRLQSHLVELAVDDEPAVRLEAKFNILAPPDQVYVLGGDGFIGCIESLTIDDRLQDMRQYEKTSLAAGGDSSFIWDRCSLWDRCQPNPCKNGGTCRGSSWNDFACICPYGYSGRLCSNVDFPHSCEEYTQFLSKEFHASSMWIDVDLDDVGPSNPLAVECRLDGSTVLHHDQLEPVEIHGFMDRGSAHINFKYSNVDSDDRLDSLAVSSLTRRSKECNQEMSYKCYGGASLMQKTTNGAIDDQGPSSWWLSWMATHIYAWGDGQPGSRMCSCSVFGSCTNGRRCNCDGSDSTAGEDVGNATIKELLPIRRIFVGDTDFANKRAAVKVGPMVCSGDESLEPATFLERRAYIEVPFRGQSGAGVESDLAGYLQFRTRECLISLISTIRRTDSEDDDGCEYLRLHIEDCRTAVLTICGGGGVTKLMANFSQSIDDDVWHSVKFMVTETAMVITLDNDPESRAVVDHLYTSPDISTIAAWRLGATGERGSGFTGAMRSVFLTGHWTPLYNLDGKVVHGNVKEGLVNRCVSTVEDGLDIEGGSCVNGGRCEEYYHSVVCDCSETPFTGTRCQEDVSYDLVGSLVFPSDSNSGIASSGHKSNLDVEYLRLGFQTKTVRCSLLRGFDQRSKADAIALLLTDAGHLRLLYMDNLTPYTIEEDGRNFADGYFHNVEIKLDAENGSIVMEVDHHRVRKLEWHPNKIGSPLRRLDWIIGDDGATSLFSGCVSRLQIGTAFFPFKTFGAMLRAVVEGNETKYRKSMCPAIDDNLSGIRTRFLGSESVDVPTKPFDTITHWSDAPRIKMRPLKQSFDKSVLVGVMGATATCMFLLVLCCLVRLCRNRPAGEYKTHEETLYLSGPTSGNDSSRQALVTAAGEPSPSPVERREWFI